MSLDNLTTGAAKIYLTSGAAKIRQKLHNLNSGISSAPSSNQYLCIALDATSI